MDKRDKKIRQLEDERNQLMAENQELKYIINLVSIMFLLTWRETLKKSERNR